MDAALEIAQTDIADLTMRSVSDRLQVSVGALYKHIAGREELITLVVEKILSQAPPMSADAADGWLALRAQVLGLSALVDQYPGLDEIVIAHSPNSPKANELRRDGIAALTNHGLTTEEAFQVYRAVTYLWLGSRVAARGRARNSTDIDTFALALDILLKGMEREITESRQRQAAPSHEKEDSA